MPAQKPLKPIFAAVNDILDKREAAERAEQQRQIELERQRLEQARAIARADKEIKTEQMAVFKDNFEPALEQLAALGGGKLFAYNVDTSGSEYNVNKYRFTPVLEFNFGSVKNHNSLHIKIFAKDSMSFSTDGGSSYYNAKLDYITKLVAQSALDWQPKEVAALARKEKRAAQPKKPAQGPKS